LKCICILQKLTFASQTKWQYMWLIEYLKSVCWSICKTAAGSSCC